jgi:hypothetical protein
VIDHASRIAPILRELDEIRELDQPVRVKADLLPLFSKHTVYADIKVKPLSGSALAIAQTRDLKAFHISSSADCWAHIYYTPCAAHDTSETLPDCPACCDSRFFQTKELVHLLDDETQRTNAEGFDKELLKELIAGNYGANAQVRADGDGEDWAVELLVRYRHRIVATGNGTLPTESRSLTAARSTGEWRLFASLYCVPAWCVQLAFAPRTMSAMKVLREQLNLSTAVAPAGAGN